MSEDKATQPQRLDRPTFSVVIPCYNAEAHVAETLASVSAQTFGDWEAILVDDGSTDNTAAILDLWAAADPRFRVVRLPNGGPSRARNYGAKVCARGRYIAFLDSDDLWAAHKLAVTAEAFSADVDLDGLYGRVAFFRDAPEAARTVSSIGGGALTPLELLEANTTCTMSNVVIRTDVFNASRGFDPTIVYAEDLEWLVRVTAAGARIEALNDTLVFYRSSDDGLSINVEKMHAGWSSAVASARHWGVNITQGRLNAAEAKHLRLLARRALRGRAPRFAALKLAVRGALRSPVGFFGDPRRGVLTLAAAIVEPMLPDGLRRLSFQF